MKEKLEIKRLLVNYCSEFVQNKEEQLLEMLNSYKTALFTETKSSAGDKHETGRAMLQLEMEKASQQLESVNLMKITLAKLKFEINSKKIGLGSLIYTTKGTYFLAISIGNVSIKTIEYFIISVNSPIGNQLLGKHFGEIISFNGAKILEIY